MSWLPDMDLNHDKQIQSLLCYRYTIGQAGACGSVNLSLGESSRQRGTGFQPVSNVLVGCRSNSNTVSREFDALLNRFISNQRQAGSLSHN
jgi:hypothetical protein